MNRTEWWLRGPVEGVAPALQPVAHILLEVRETVGPMVEGLTESQWNARPGGVASVAFHVRHIAGVVDRLFTYARGATLTPEQVTAMRGEGAELRADDVSAALDALAARLDAAVAELRTVDAASLGDHRAIGRAKLPSTVIGCLVHAAEHAMRHTGQLSVTARVVRATTPSA
ncbi:MAG: DinB family protein [Gemmatimonadetes bacterium]|nr:DinB family protein [Gemmatimonadota bacterium]